MRDRVVAVRAVPPLVGVVLTLAGCAAPGGPSLPVTSLPVTGRTSSTVLALAADAQTCVPVAGSTLCHVLVHYANESIRPLDLDATTTRLQDSAGRVYRGSTDAAVPYSLVLAPGQKVSLDWAVSLPTSVHLDLVTWTGPDGQTAGAAVPAVLESTASPTPSSASPTRSVTPTRSPTATPTRKPTPAPTRVVPKPTPPPVIVRPKPTPTPPPQGTIG